MADSDATDRARPSLRRRAFSVSSLVFVAASIVKLTFSLAIRTSIARLCDNGSISRYLDNGKLTVTRLRTLVPRSVTGKMTGKIVSYLRVSTDRQGRSGLGLEGQRAAVESYVKRTGAAIAREFVEVESGRHDDRPKLAEALAFARRAKATLCVAKLDRLSRSVRFIAQVLDSGVEFAAADMPDANRMTLHILAAIAEGEAKAISDRTRAALQAARAKGVKLGAHNPACRPLTLRARRKGQALGAQSNRQCAFAAYADLVPNIANLRARGCSLREIARRLTDDGHATRSDKGWTAVQVMRVLRRVA